MYGYFAMQLSNKTHNPYIGHFVSLIRGFTSMDKKFEFFNRYIEYKKHFEMDDKIDTILYFDNIVDKVIEISEECLNNDIIYLYNTYDNACFDYLKAVKVSNKLETLTGEYKTFRLYTKEIDSTEIVYDFILDPIKIRSSDKDITRTISMDCTRREFKIPETWKHKEYRELKDSDTMYRETMELYKSK